MKIKNFTYNYGKKVIFQDVDLYFEDGQLNFILGANQSGKTTLLDHIADIDGSRTDNFIGFPKKKAIAYLGQDNRFKVELLVGDILAFIRQLEGVSDFAMPETIEKLQLLKYGDLNYGQRKLVLIYLNTMVDKELYLFDEPENGVELGYSQEIFGWMRELIDLDKTLIVTTNKLDNIHDVDNVNYIKNPGEILVDSYLKIKTRMAF